MRKIAYGIGLAVAMLLGIWLTYTLMSRQQEKITQQQATVLLQQVDKVMKLVTVQGNFDETYDEERIRELRLLLPVPTTLTFPKKAFVQVKGTVSVGYDLSQATVILDSTTRTLSIRNLPQAKILAIDHTLRYHLLEESWFNTFTPKDYTEINTNAKTALRNAALKSPLMQSAEQEGQRILQLVSELAHAVGWTVIIKRTPDRARLDHHQSFPLLRPAESPWR